MLKTLIDNCELYCSDYRELVKRIEDHSVDLVIADPPYSYEYNFKEGNGGSVNDLKKMDRSLMKLNELNSCNYNIEEFANEMIRIMKGINIYIWCNKVQIPKYIELFVTKHKCKFEIIVWNKSDALPTYYNKYLTDCEYCLYFHKNVSVHPNNYEDAKTVYLGKINRQNKEFNHPTVKPLELTQRFIRNSSKENDLVFDPFMGSGTTGVACKNENRRFIGSEILQKHYETSIKRIRGYGDYVNDIFDS